MSTFTKEFGIPTGTAVEFQDIPLIEDLKAFIDPFLIANNRSEKIFRDLYITLEAFFKKLNQEFIIPNDRNNGLIFLDKLHEPNEYHFGYSPKNKGAAISDMRADTIFDALRNNRFAQQGVSITNEAHNILLLVEGIGQDIMSDTIANVCRGVFAKFTHEQCVKYAIDTETFKRYYFNTQTESWEIGDFQLPTFNGKCIILVPRRIASSPRSYVNHYNYFIAKHRISVEILNDKATESSNKRFIRTLKNGEREAIIKKIYKAYRKPKSKLIDFVITYKGSLEDFWIMQKNIIQHWIYLIYNFDTVNSG